MSFTFNGLSGAAVTISGTTTANGLFAPSATQTPVIGSAIGQNDGTTVYTATAGKTFYCTGLSINSNNVNVGSTLSVNGTARFRCSGGTATTANMSLSGGVLFTLAATTSCTISGAGAAQNTCVVWGYEV